jgi:hypothetical protein
LPQRLGFVALDAVLKSFLGRQKLPSEWPRMTPSYPKLPLAIV